MASKIKQDLLKELATLRRHTDSEYKIALLDGLAEKIDTLDNDRDIRNAVWANRELTSRSFTMDEFKVMPKVADIVMGQPASDTIDLNKEFGKNWQKDFGNIPVSKIQFVADKNGIDWKQLNQHMADEATRSQRYAIAHGEDKGGWFDSPEAFAHNLGGATMRVFGRRQQEAIERGEEPTAKDYVGDIGESALYAVPYSRGIGLVLRGGKVATGVKTGAQLAAAPLISETYDANVYSDDNPRGQFSVGDVAGGVMTNMAAPWLARKLIGQGGRYVTGETVKTAKAPAQELAREDIVKELKKGYTSQSSAQGFATKRARGRELTPDQQQIAKKFDAAQKAKFDAVRKKLQQGQTQFTDEEIDIINAYPELQRAWHINEYPTRSALMAKEGAAGWLTNQYASVSPEQSPFYHRIPLAGPAFQKWQEEKEEQEAEEKMIKEIEDKWKIRFGVK